MAHCDINYWCALQEMRENGAEALQDPFNRAIYADLVLEHGHEFAEGFLRPMIF